jgi:hypothetical protein
MILSAILKSYIHILFGWENIAYFGKIAYFAFIAKSSVLYVILFNDEYAIAESTANLR